MPSQTRLASAMTELLRLFQLALFNLHIFEFARLEHLAALEAFHKFGVFFASDYPYARMFALGRVILHRRRLDRRDVVIDSGLSLSRALMPRADSRRNWRIFIVQR